VLDLGGAGEDLGLRVAGGGERKVVQRVAALGPPGEQFPPVLAAPLPVAPSGCRGPSA
jgi:hypothetical protein